MTNDLHERAADRLSPRLASARLGPHAAEEHQENSSAPARHTDAERQYVDTCQKLEQLIERKRRSEEETGDVSSLHRELCLIGKRIQREPNERSHEDDYLAILHQVKESLWHKLEAEQLKGEFQQLHFELLGLGHRLEFEQVRATEPLTEQEPDRYEPAVVEEINLSDVEVQIAKLQAQIRGLHDYR